MTTDEAIAILVGFLNNADGVVSQKLPIAVGLGIEALKRVKTDRFMAFPYVLNPLPGETKE